VGQLEFTDGTTVEISCQFLSSRQTKSKVTTTAFIKTYIFRSSQSRAGEESFWRALSHRFTVTTHKPIEMKKIGIQSRAPMFISKLMSVPDGWEK
jgi:hypothetical protein